MFLADVWSPVIFFVTRIMPEWMFGGLLVILGIVTFASAPAERPWPARLGGIALLFVGIMWYLAARDARAG